MVARPNVIRMFFKLVPFAMRAPVLVRAAADERRLVTQARRLGRAVSVGHDSRNVGSRHRTYPADTQARGGPDPPHLLLTRKFVNV
ncbi:hypothetical protein GCM10023114_28140 [Mycolicibacterium sediminis]|uniref:Uncharacterized protein n=1 Tax=Mycolicibacterium sediminis TaxID=1286180 RepID=A0A7I7QWU6_9MYCO|nr:hypothetical protein MSEDJ_48970 [Mycolicibacterium sediminis]